MKIPLLRGSTVLCFCDFSWKMTHENPIRSFFDQSHVLLKPVRLGLSEKLKVIWKCWGSTELTRWLCQQRPPIINVNPYQTGISWFSRKIQAKIPFVHYTLSSPSKHFGTLFLVIVELYQGPEDPPGPSWTPKWTPKWILRGKFWRTVGKKGPSRAPSWSKVINFFR